LEPIQEKSKLVKVLKKNFIRDSTNGKKNLSFVQNLYLMLFLSSFCHSLSTQRGGRVITNIQRQIMWDKEVKEENEE